MAALLFRSKLILKVDTRSAGFDEGLHDLEAVERSAKPGLASATIGANQLRFVPPSECSI